ncbi:SHOCT domain-containing protein [Rummeliibacillus stabekisii]|uniref:SHOCT domain-containing protein n=1 Tax=Rummeliibacillus stabekisii TaxID=241244 RepID=UPI0037183198
MGFFDSKAICAVCNKETGLNRYRIANKEWICPECFKEAGLKKLGLNNKPIQKMTIEDIREAMSKKKANDDELIAFTPTKRIGNYIEFDDDNRKWLILSSILGKRDKSHVYKYGDIVDFELLEDGESITEGGIGRALAGGVLFGKTGAIVGGVTGKRKNKAVCTNLKIKITLNDINNPVAYITFLNTKTKKDGFIYKTAFKDAQECLSVFHLICNGNTTPTPSIVNNEVATSAADEIKKFKELLDDGILSQEEFDTKKKQLLGI